MTEKLLVGVWVVVGTIAAVGLAILVTGVWRAVLA